MKETWDHDKAMMLEYQDKFCQAQIAMKDLNKKLIEVQSQLNLSRSLNAIPKSPPSHALEEVNSNTVTSVNIKDAENRVNPDIQGNKQGEVCLFELAETGRCKRGNACKFTHEIPAHMRETKELDKKLVEMSQNLGRCTYEMVKKGSCPRRNECQYPHLKESRKGRKSQGHVGMKRVCFHELEGIGKCLRGAEACRYSHDISNEERNNKAFVDQVQHERHAKKGLCINEYWQKDSCHKGESCPYRHDITEQERQSPELKNKMSQRWNQITGRSRKNTDTEEKDEEGMTSFAILKEFRTLMKNFNQMITKNKRECP